MITFPVIRAKLDAGAGIRQGDTVILKAIKPLAGGMWQVSHNGRLIVIKSEITLYVGQELRTRVLSPGPKLVLQLLELAGERLSATAVMQFPAGIPNDTFARTLIQAFQHRGSQVDLTMLAKARSVYARLRKKDLTSAGVLISLIDKGYEPNAKFVDGVMDFLGQGSGGGNRPGTKRRNREERTFESVSSIKIQLRRQVRATSGETELLHLFNHVEAEHENWILLPFRVAQADEVLTGTIRLRTGRLKGITRMVLDTVTENGNISFSMNWPLKPASGIKVRSDDRKLLTAIFRDGKEVGEKLRYLNLINDDNKTEGDFDRFTQEEVAPTRNVDELV